MNLMMKAPLPEGMASAMHLSPCTTLHSREEDDGLDHDTGRMAEAIASGIHFFFVIFARFVVKHLSQSRDPTDDEGSRRIRIALLFSLNAVHPGPNFEHPVCSQV